MRMATCCQLRLLLLAVACSVGQNMDVDITPAHQWNQFVPNQTLGAGIDRGLPRLSEQASGGVIAQFRRLQRRTLLSPHISVSRR